MPAVFGACSSLTSALGASGSAGLGGACVSAAFASGLGGAGASAFTSGLGGAGASAFTSGLLSCFTGGGGVGLVSDARKGADAALFTVFPSFAKFLNSPILLKASWETLSPIRIGCHCGAVAAIKATEAASPPIRPGNRHLFPSASSILPREFD